jgi:putative NADH-flavin reductase
MIIAATKAAKVPRLLVVGGAGSLEVSPGLTLVNTPDFPAEYKPETLARVEFLNVLRGEKELDWTFLSPSYLFAPANAPADFDSVKTNFWLLLTAKAAYQTLRSHLWTSWNSRSTLANDSQLGTDN